MIKMRLFQLTWALPILMVCIGSSLANLTVIYEWKYIDYDWENETQKEEAVQSGQYNHTKIITNDVQQLPDGRVLITTPKYFDNPASLSTVSSESGEGGPLLEPYPSWDWHKTAGDCSGITSVNRVRLDKCNRLWVVDSGKIGNEQVCSAEIFIFNATTGELLEQIEIPDSISHNPNDPTKGKLEIQVVETVGDTCEQTWAYIADVEGWGLLIYNGSAIWRLNDDIYAPEDGATEFSINGQNVTLNNGVSSMLLPPPGFVKTEYVLFKPMASVKGYAATREQLHNSYSGINVTYYMSNFTIPSQELARDYSSDGVLIAGFPTQTAIACWNLEYPLAHPYVVCIHHRVRLKPYKIIPHSIFLNPKLIVNITVILEESLEDLQFVSGLKVTKGIQNGVEGENVWTTTNRLQQFMTGTMDFTDYNFRVLGTNVAALVNGTICQPEPYTVANTIEDKFFFEM